MASKEQQGVVDRMAHSAKEAVISAAGTGAGVVAQPREGVRRIAAAMMSKRSLAIGLAFVAGLVIAAWARRSQR